MDLRTLTMVGPAEAPPYAAGAADNATADTDIAADPMAANFVTTKPHAKNEVLQPPDKVLDASDGAIARRAYSSRPGDSVRGGACAICRIARRLAATPSTQHRVPLALSKLDTPNDPSCSRRSTDRALWHPLVVAPTRGSPIRPSMCQ
jgi:hypothetical protein